MDERFEKVGNGGCYAVKSEIFLSKEVVENLKKIAATNPDFNLDVFITGAVCDRVDKKIKDLSISI